jgi:hypothetical protein
MAEKRGQTEKLVYDFPTQLSTEIGYEDGFWIRVHCNRFRSYNGPRRILHLDKEGKGEYQEYNGPVYYYESNKRLKDKTKKGYVYLNDIVPKPQLRPGEMHFLEDERVRKQLGK